ncbi:GNAT family N-acetyltransferase [Streptomyces sp. H27-H5]|uniref:GNAT family N-acetyltransferase n=1 Tax=Streptomyces sp. H27-H5 TaxID=2996460 RepID=UPI0022700178|nr:GNAT family N-acetyltransferase [Streptomyces sp. H27-H5]MCY0955996.1 GNAT family N-acetyltransferase [Streptomyces sp. H27-H5]
MPTATLPAAAPSPRATATRRRDAPDFSVRPAHRDEGPELAALSWPFVRAGALRERPLSLYLSRASDFLVAQAPDGTLEGCLALREHSAAGVLYNFCVAGHRQGTGMGARLLHAAFAAARARSMATLFTATTGSGRLFLRHGFVPTSPSLAPTAWARSLDPGRNAHVLSRAL